MTVSPNDFQARTPSPGTAVGLAARFHRSATKCLWWMAACSLIASCADPDAAAPQLASQSGAWSGCDKPADSDSPCAAAIQWHLSHRESKFRTADGRLVPVVLVCADIGGQGKRPSKVWVAPQEIESEHERYRVDGQMFYSLDDLLNYLGPNRKKLIARFAQVYVHNVGSLWSTRIGVGNSLGLDAHIEYVPPSGDPNITSDLTLSRIGGYLMIPPGAQGLIEFTNRNYGIDLSSYDTLTVDETISNARNELTIHYFQPEPAL